MHFPEEFLCYIWQFNLLHRRELSGTAGETIRVVSPGLRNAHAGPDFIQARLFINEVCWIGNIEIHWRSSDWLLHQHDVYGAYSNVILHVVYENDTVICRSDGTSIPALVLKGLFNENLRWQYEQLLQSNTRFSCQHHIKEVAPIWITQFLSRLGVERLIERSDELLLHLKRLKGNWEETFYHYLGKSFGFHINAVPMEMLVNSLPFHILSRHKDNPLQVEALLFGQAGFLSTSFQEAYPLRLKTEYAFLQKKYKLKPVDVALWKFMRMRPQNFPTLRIAQFAALLICTEHLFAEILDKRQLSDLTSLFRFLPVNSYWLTHYHFHKKTKRVNTQLGQRTIRHLTINVISLFWFTYGRYFQRDDFIDETLDLLDRLPAEQNNITQMYLHAGVHIPSAATTQALLQLNQMYCEKKRCLQCGIGVKLIRQLSLI